MQKTLPQVDDSTYDSHYDVLTQSFNYDSLNRLQDVHDGTVWQQKYSYDRWGNRLVDQNPANTFGTNIPKPNFGVEASTNRLTVPSGQSGTMTYDAAGNLTTDTYSAAAVTRAYDAENRMTSETQAYSYVVGSYAYDGDGRRVKRVVNGVETWQVYGIGGELIAEYAQHGSVTTPQKEYGYRHGQLLITGTPATDWGSVPTLHDNPLVVNETTVQARHVTELRTAIDALRTHLGMSGYPWATSATTNDLISADPIVEMRVALNEALGAPSPAYATGLALGQPIRAVHIQELRDRVLAAWSNGSSTPIHWLVTDQLGTPRMIFDQSGSLANTSRHDYLPFGEEIFAGTAGRTTARGYPTGPNAVDGARHKFIQNERDNETGLDFFEARYYSSTQGRFTSVDPLISSASLIEPQSWNRYSYCLGNPLRFVDPSGLEPEYYWITNGQGYYQALTREQFDAFLQDKERVQNWYPVPSGTVIPKESNQAFWGDVTPEFRQENSRFLWLRRQDQRAGASRICQQHALRRFSSRDVEICRGAHASNDHRDHHPGLFHWPNW